MCQNLKCSRSSSILRRIFKDLHIWVTMTPSIDDRSDIPAILPSLKLYPNANSLPNLVISELLDFSVCLLAGNAPTRWSFATAHRVMPEGQTLPMRLRRFLPARLLNPDM